MALEQKIGYMCYNCITLHFIIHLVQNRENVKDFIKCKNFYES